MMTPFLPSHSLKQPLTQDLLARKMATGPSLEERIIDLAAAGSDPRLARQAIQKAGEAVWEEKIITRPTSLSFLAKISRLWNRFVAWYSGFNAELASAEKALEKTFCDWASFQTEEVNALIASALLSEDKDLTAEHFELALKIEQLPPLDREIFDKKFLFGDQFLKKAQNRFSYCLSLHTNLEEKGKVDALITSALLSEDKDLTPEHFELALKIERLSPLERRIFDKMFVKTSAFLQKIEDFKTKTKAKETFLSLPHPYSGKAVPPEQLADDNAYLAKVFADTQREPLHFVGDIPRNRRYCTLNFDGAPYKLFCAEPSQILQEKATAKLHSLASPSSTTPEKDPFVLLAKTLFVPKIDFSICYSRFDAYFKEQFDFAWGLSSPFQTSGSYLSKKLEKRADGSLYVETLFSLNLLTGEDLSPVASRTFCSKIVARINEQGQPELSSIVVKEIENPKEESTQRLRQTLTLYAQTVSDFTVINDLPKISEVLAEDRHNFLSTFHPFLRYPSLCQKETVLARSIFSAIRKKENPLRNSLTNGIEFRVGQQVLDLPEEDEERTEIARNALQQICTDDQGAADPSLYELGAALLSPDLTAGPEAALAFEYQKRVVFTHNLFPDIAVFERSPLQSEYTHRSLQKVGPSKLRMDAVVKHTFSPYATNTFLKAEKLYRYTITATLGQNGRPPNFEYLISAF